MKTHFLIAILLCTTFSAKAQNGYTPITELLLPKTTLPIRFTNSFDANHARAGDLVYARTTQRVPLAGGETLAAGAEVIGHVVMAEPFVFDKTPYAVQKQSTLLIRFDSVISGTQRYPLEVYVRALADPITSWNARDPGPYQNASLTTFTQIGGDAFAPFGKEVKSANGDVVGYNRRDGVYAHLIAASGHSPNVCDASNVEEPMGLFSASACGLYGFTGVTLRQAGKMGPPSTLVLTSNRVSPKIWKNSTALLEVLP